MNSTDVLTKQELLSWYDETADSFRRFSDVEEYQIKADRLVLEKESLDFKYVRAFRGDRSAGACVAWYPYGDLGTAYKKTTAYVDGRFRVPMRKARLQVPRSFLLKFIDDPKAILKHVKIPKNHVLGAFYIYDDVRKDGEIKIYGSIKDESEIPIVGEGEEIPLVTDLKKYGIKLC